LKQPLVVLVLLLAACIRAPSTPLKLFPLVAVWETALEGPVIPPLATDGARVFASAEGAGLVALDSGTGDLVWEAPELEGRLAASGEALYLLTATGELWCLDPLNGSRRWRVETGITDAQAPVVAGDRVVLAGRGAAAFEALAGRPLWTALDGERATTPPAVGAGLLIASEAGGRVHARDVASGASLWVRVLGRELIAPPAVDDSGRVFIGTLERSFLCLDGRDGGKTRWRWRVGTAIHQRALPVRDRVAFASLENVLYSLKSGGGDMVWRQGLPGRALSGPTLVGGAFLLATQEGFLMGFNPESGRGLGSLRLEGEIAAPPIVVGDRFVAALRTRSIAAVAITGAPPESPISNEP
jgi:outer membrane protein assembly factor BamB